MKSEKYKGDIEVSEFIDGQDHEDHFQVQGDLDISGIM